MADSKSIEGFYTAYFTGAAGNSIGVFVFKDGVVVGADAGGGRYDGTYTRDDEGVNITANIKFFLPIGNFSITGITADVHPLAVEMSLELPSELNRNDVHLLQTPLGPVNAKFEKIRGI